MFFGGVCVSYLEWLRARAHFLRPQFNPGWFMSHSFGQELAVFDRTAENGNYRGRTNLGIFLKYETFIFSDFDKKSFLLHQ